MFMLDCALQPLHMASEWAKFVSAVRPTLDVRKTGIRCQQRFILHPSWASGYLVSCRARLGRRACFALRRRQQRASAPVQLAWGPGCVPSLTPVAFRFVERCAALSTIALCHSRSAMALIRTRLWWETWRFACCKWITGAFLVGQVAFELGPLVTLRCASV